MLDMVIFVLSRCFQFAVADIFVAHTSMLVTVSSLFGIKPLQLCLLQYRLRSIGSIPYLTKTAQLSINFLLAAHTLVFIKEFYYNFKKFAFEINVLVLTVLAT
jgi:hypothetical protein